MTTSRYVARRPRGRPPHPDVLTRREWEVYYLLRMGLTNQEIAGCLGISFAAAKFHVAEVIGRLGVETRKDVSRLAIAPRHALRDHGVTTRRPAAPVRPRHWRLYLGGLAGAMLLGLLLLSTVLGGSDHALLFPAIAMGGLAIAGLLGLALTEVAGRRA